MLFLASYISDFSLLYIIFNSILRIVALLRNWDGNVLLLSDYFLYTKLLIKKVFCRSIIEKIVGCHSNVSK